MNRHLAERITASLRLAFAPPIGPSPHPPERSLTRIHRSRDPFPRVFEQSSGSGVTSPYVMSPEGLERPGYDPELMLEL